MRSDEGGGERRRGWVSKVVRFLGWWLGVLVVALVVLWQVANWRGTLAWERAQERLVEEGEVWTLEEVFGSDELEEIDAMLNRFDPRGACLRACRGELVTALWMLDLIEAGDVEMLKHDQVSDAAIDVLEWFPSGWVDGDRVTLTTWMTAHLLPLKRGDWRGALAGGRRVEAMLIENRDRWRAFRVPHAENAFAMTAPYDAILGRSTERMVWWVSAVERCRVACAVERYRHERAGYPERLEELVSGYLAVVAEDVTNEAGGHLGYRREGERYVDWSAGTNGEDDGGESGGLRESPRWGGFEGDWVWRYGVVE